MTFNQAVDCLEKAKIEDAKHEVTLIFEKLFSITPAQILLRRNENFESPELNNIIAGRIANYPLQYLLGEWEFYGLPFKVNENCLCPRADTESLVEKAIEILPRNAKVLELCTGSGCISVALCKNREDVLCRATDISDETLKLAKYNAKQNKVDSQIEFIKSDVFQSDEFLFSPEKEFLFNGEKLDAIVSNPPYIPSGEIRNLSKTVLFEPHIALDGGDDGLDFYREIVSNYGKYLKNSGKFIFEIGFDQGEALKKIAADNLLFCEIYKDICDNDRVAVLYKNNQQKGDSPK